MSFVLTTADAVHCGHSGTVEVTGGAKLTVRRQPVLLVAGVAGKPMLGCTTPTNTGTPCTAVATITGGAAARLTVGRLPVALGGSGGLAGTTNGLVGGAVQPLRSTTAGQGKLTAR